MPEIIPNSDKIEVKGAFQERYKSLLGDRYDEFMKFSLSWLRRAIRVNTLKADVDYVKKKLEKSWTLTQVPWCKEGFWAESDRRDLGNTTEHQLGQIYVQEPASMIPPVVLDPQPGDTILDMCAAPGSKSTQIAMYMKNKGILVCNDFKYDRLKSLGLNMQRCGVTNNVLTLNLGHLMQGAKFDRILVDAPCSGTGTIRKSLKTLRIWNPGMISRLAATQKKLIEKGFELLNPGGTLVYSTCSLEPQEDEGVVTHLLENHDNAVLDSIKLKINRSDAISGFGKEKYHKEIKKCIRIWPQDNDTEGFFVARIKKQ